MSDIIIGKHTLESLTSGMYSDPYVVFREYIQNAADSIDSAYEAAVLKPGEDQINITLAPAERKIIIEDNGVGISQKNALKSLVSIGNSKKSSDSERGFRGIGRLSGLSYCSKLVFETSCLGEGIKTIVVFDAKRLSYLLTSDIGTDISATDVLQEVYTIERDSCAAKEHFFRVIMEGVDESSGLNKFADVLDYLSQNVPVPYSPDFSWGKEIEKRLKREGYESRKYNLHLSFGPNTVPVYKPYKDVFLVDKGKNLTDHIRDISIVKIHQSAGNLSAIGWIAETNYLGSIYDKSIKGIRLKKGNILIGDSQTLNVVFKDARFNGWSIGEVFAIDPHLVPNARRDNFEKNSAFFSLHEQLMTIASGITKEIRSASLKRNSELAEALKHSEQIISTAEEEVINGITHSQKGAIVQKVDAARKKLTEVSIQMDSDEYYQSVAFEELDILIGKIRGATEYKSINISNTLSKAEKKILEQVFDVITSTVDSKVAEDLISKILESFEAHPR